MKLQNKLFTAVLVASSSLSIHAVEKANEARLDEIAQRGTQIMPFNLDQTVHVFSKKEDGGLQQVVVKNQTNTGQIKLIRQHLNEIANKFKQGDFSDPSKLHGDNMPGLAILKKARPGEINIIYTELSDGAQIVYSSDDPALILAIHQWFDAQLSDHARHAMPNYPHHLMHPK